LSMRGVERLRKQVLEPTPEYKGTSDMMTEAMFPAPGLPPRFSALRDTLKYVGYFCTPHAQSAKVRVSGRVAFKIVEHIYANVPVLGLQQSSERNNPRFAQLRAYQEQQARGADIQAP